MRIMREGVGMKNDGRVVRVGAMRWNDKPIPVTIPIGHWHIEVGKMFDLRREADNSITAEVDLWCDPGDLKPECDVSLGGWDLPSFSLHGDVVDGLIYGMSLGHGPAWDDLGVME